MIAFKDLFFAALATLLLTGTAAEAQLVPPQSAGPVPVEIGVYLLDVTEISEIEATFRMEGFMALQWRDAPV